MESVFEDQYGILELMAAKKVFSKEQIGEIAHQDFLAELAIALKGVNNLGYFNK